MDKKEFINTIMKGFPSSFKGLDVQNELNKYETAIDNDLDYDKLYELFLKDWKWKTAPQPAYFQKFIPKCRKSLTTKLINMPSERRAALVKVANWFNSPEYEKCLYSGQKAPWYIREEIKKHNLDAREIDLARISGELA